MRLIYLSLGIIFLLFIFGLAWSNRTVSEVPDNYTQTITNSSGMFTVNGTDTSLQYGGSTLVLGITLTQGILASVIAIVAFGTAIGIKVFDSGISEFSQKIIFFFAIYMGIYGILSVFAYSLIMLIPVFGWIIFFSLTVVHLLGIVQEINGASTQ